MVALLSEEEKPLILGERRNTYTLGEDVSQLASEKSAGASASGASTTGLDRRQAWQRVGGFSERFSTSIRARRDSIVNSATYKNVISDANSMEYARMRSISGSVRSLSQWMDEIELAEEEAVPFDPHAAELGGNLTSAVLGIIKGMVGPAILYLPHGFATAGYVIALPIMIISTCMYLYSSQCLLEAWKLESTRQGGQKFWNILGDSVSQDLSMDDFFGTAILEGDDEENDDNHDVVDNEKGFAIQKQRQKQATTPLVGTPGKVNKIGGRKGGLLQKSSQSQTSKRLQSSKMLSYPELSYRALGRLGERWVKVGIALMQSGVCLTYLIFVPHNLSKSIEILFGTYTSPIVWLWTMIVLEVPLSWIRDIRKLTWTNLLANAFILYGLCTCIALAIVTASKSPTSIEYGDIDLEVMDLDNIIMNPIQSILFRLQHVKPLASGWFLFIGTSVLLFEGSITLLIPIQEAITAPYEREIFPNVYFKVICCIIMFYIIFALIEWMAFGDDIRTVLTTSLPNGILATSVQLVYSIAVIFTFPLQNFPALEISIDTIQNMWKDKCGYCCGGGVPPRNLLSSCLVILLAFVALATLESLDKVVSLMGSLLGIPIAFVFPPIIHTKLSYKNNSNISTLRLFGNYCVAGLGLIAMILASITTIITWK